jgi:hypothetical protein
MNSEQSTAPCHGTLQMRGGHYLRVRNANRSLEKTPAATQWAKNIYRISPPLDSITVLSIKTLNYFLKIRYEQHGNNELSTTW